MFKFLRTSNDNFELFFLSYIIIVIMDCCRAYSQVRCPKGLSNGKKIAKNYFGFLLCSLFRDYKGLVYDYN